MAWKIPLFKIYTDSGDVKAVQEVLERGSYWTTGPEVEEFEKRVASIVGRKYGVSFANGTAALHAAMLAYGFGAGDEVIVPSFTFISTANSALFVGAKPVFADIEPETMGLDPADVRKRITEHTKAIMPVHVGGAPCLIRELKEIADEHGLILIEDAAEAFGAIAHGKPVGSHGDMAMYSFCQNKVMTTGEGGMLVTDDEDIYQNLKLVRSHGRAEDADYFAESKHFDYIQLGYNFRMSSITAALGLSQIAKVENIIDMRRELAKKYNAAFEGMDEVSIPREKEGNRNVYQLYTIRFRSETLRDRVQKALIEKGVMSKIYFDPVHLMHFYRNMGHTEGELPVTETVAKEVLTLPLYPGLGVEVARTIGKDICSIIKGVFDSV